MLHVRYVSNTVVLLEEDPHRRTLYLGRTLSRKRKVATLSLPYMIYICHVVKQQGPLYFMPMSLGVGSRNTALKSGNDVIHRAGLIGSCLSGVCLGSGMPKNYEKTAVEAAMSLVRAYYATPFYYNGPDLKTANLVGPDGDLLTYGQWIALTAARSKYVPKIDTNRDPGRLLFTIIDNSIKLRPRLNKAVTVESLTKKD